LSSSLGMLLIVVCIDTLTCQSPNYHIAFLNIAHYSKELRKTQA